MGSILPLMQQLLDAGFSFAGLNGKGWGKPFGTAPSLNA